MHWTLREGATRDVRRCKEASAGISSEALLGLQQKLDLADIGGRLEREGEVDVQDIAETRTCVAET